MSNESYCRFENTLRDLRDCQGVLDAEDLSPEEEEARRRLIETCKEIVEDWTD